MLSPKSAVRRYSFLANECGYLVPVWDYWLFCTTRNVSIPSFATLSGSRFSGIANPWLILCCVPASCRVTQCISIEYWLIGQCSASGYFSFSAASWLTSTTSFTRREYIDGLEQLTAKVYLIGKFCGRGSWDHLSVFASFRLSHFCFDWTVLWSSQLYKLATRAAHIYFPRLTRPERSWASRHSLKRYDTRCET